jgi:DNA replication and repair protein RecF
MAKSHRTHRDQELLKWQNEAAKIRGLIDKKQGQHDLAVYLSKKGKKVLINGLEKKKLSDFVGFFNVVMFAPEDLNLVKGSPQVRRRFLDMELVQTNPTYLYHLNQYNQVLTQRNQLLKNTQTSRDHEVLNIWNEQLVDFGTKIMLKRHQFVQELEVWARKLHHEMTRGLEHFSMVYQPSIPVAQLTEDRIKADFMVKLKQVEKQETMRGVTLLGPHRDELTFQVNGMDVQTFGSQGQQRTTALSLKLAEIEFIRQQVGEYPVLLLDDVMSELDPMRQEQLFGMVYEKVQTFITTTHLDAVYAKFPSNASQNIYVENGRCAAN